MSKQKERKKKSQTKKETKPNPQSLETPGSSRPVLPPPSVIQKEKPKEIKGEIKTKKKPQPTPPLSPGQSLPGWGSRTSRERKVEAGAKRSAGPGALCPPPALGA